MPSRNHLIEQYFYEGYKYSEICQFLGKNGSPISKRHLKRILKFLNLKRKRVDEDIDDCIAIILKELKQSGSCLGYKTLFNRLRGPDHKKNIRRSTVLKILHIVDPEGIEERSRYRLKR